MQPPGQAMTSMKAYFFHECFSSMRLMKRRALASWENPEIQTLYTKFLGEPLSDLSESLLHSQYINKHYILGKEDKVQPGVSH